MRPLAIEGVIGTKPIKHFGPNPEITIRSVCKTCNEGWLSELENASRPFIGALMRDISMTLNPPEQFTMALWAIKTAIVWESVIHKVRTSRYTEEQRHALRSASKIPRHTSIWLGRYSGSGVLGAFAHDIRYEMSEAGMMVDGQASTFLVGRLALQVYTVHVPSEYRIARIGIEHKAGPWDRLLIKIHPSEGRTSWPPPHSLTNLQTLAKKWSLGDERPPS